MAFVFAWSCVCCVFWIFGFVLVFCVVGFCVFLLVDGFSGSLGCFKRCYCLLLQIVFEGFSCVHCVICFGYL